MADKRQEDFKKLQEEVKRYEGDVDRLEQKIKKFLSEHKVLTKYQENTLAKIINNYEGVSEALERIAKTESSSEGRIRKLLDLSNKLYESYETQYSIKQKIGEEIDRILDLVNKESDVESKLKVSREESLKVLTKTSSITDKSLDALREKLESFQNLEDLFTLGDENFSEDLRKSLQLAGVDYEDLITKTGKFKKSILRDEKGRVRAEKYAGEAAEEALKTLRTRANLQKLNLKTLENTIKKSKLYDDALKDITSKIDEQFTTYSAIANLIPGIGPMLSRQFDMAKDKAIEAAKVMSDEFKRTNNPITALSAGIRVMTRGLTFASGLFLGLAASATIAYKVFSSILGTVNDISKETGLAANQSYDLYKGALDSQGAFKNQLSTLEDILAVQKSFINEYGRNVPLSKKVAAQISDGAKVLGYSADTASKLQATFMELGADEGLAGNLQIAVGNLAEANKIAPGVIAQDLVNNSEFVARNFAGMPKEAAKAAIEVRKLGFSLEQAAKISDHLFDIQGSLTAQMEASVSLGKMIDVSAARRLALEGKTAAMMTEITNQMGTYSDLMNMNVPQRMLMARAFGLEVSELQKSLYIREKLAGLSDEEMDFALKHLSTLENVEKMDRAQLQAQISKAQEAERFDAAMDKIKTQLIRAILPLVEALVPALEAASTIISMMVVVLKGVRYLFEAIGFVVEGLLAPLKFINDIITDGFSKAVENFSRGLNTAWVVVKGILATFSAVYVSFKLIKSIGGATFTSIGASIKAAFSRENFNSFKEGFKDILKSGKNTFLSLKDVIKSTFKKGGLTETEAGGKGLFGNMKERIKGFFKKGDSPTETIEQSSTTQTTATPKAGDSISKFLKSLSKGLTSMGTSKVLFGSLNLIPASAGLVAMIPGALGARLFQMIDGSSLNKSFTGLSKGLAKMGDSKVLLGALALPLASLGFVAMIPGMVGARLMQMLDGSKLSKSFTGLSSGLSKMGNSKVFAGALALPIASLGLVGMIPGVLGARLMQMIDGDSLGKAFTGLAKGLVKMSEGNVFLGALALPLASLGLVAMIPGYLGAKLMQTIDGEALSVAFKGLAKGLSAMGKASVLLGSAALVLTSVALIGLIPASLGLAALAAVAPAAIPALTSLGVALTTFGSVIMTGVGAIGLAALILLAESIALAVRIMSPAIDAMANVVRAFGTVIDAIFNGLSKVVQSILQITPESATGLIALGIGLTTFSATALAASITLALAVPGLVSFGATFGYLSKIFIRTVDPLDKLSGSINRLVDGLQRLVELPMSEIKNNLKELSSLSDFTNFRIGGMIKDAISFLTQRSGPIKSEPVITPDIQNKTITRGEIEKQKETKSSFDERNDSLGSANLTAVLNRLSNLMESNNNSKYYLVFDDGALREMKLRSKTL